MKTINFLSSDADFALLIPLIAEFATKTGNPLWQHFQEVCSVFSSDRTTVIIAKDGERAIGYLCGYFIDNTNFFICQILSKDPSMTKVMFSTLEKKGADCGGKRIFGYTKAPTKAFSRYGFKFDRYLMSKEV